MRAPPAPSATHGYAVVTGAASGIGRAIAERLVGVGWSVALVDIDGDRLDEACAALRAEGGDVLALAADVASAHDWRALHRRLRDLWPRLDLLVNNAGVLAGGALAGGDPEAAARLINVNLTGQLLGCSELAPWLMECAAERPLLAGPRPGVINTASVFAALAPPGFAAYSASKAGVVAMSESLRGELAPYGLNVTVTAPGVTRTGLFQRGRLEGAAYREAADRFLKDARLTPEYVAEATLRAAARGRLYAVIGGRARRLWTLKRLLPGAVIAGLARWAARELGGSPVVPRPTPAPPTEQTERVA